MRAWFSILQLSMVFGAIGCFAVVDFDLGDDGVGGNGNGGGETTLTSTGPMGPGGGPAGGAGGEAGAPPGCVDVESNPDHCGQCNHSCEGGLCVDGVCGPVQFFEAASNILLVGAGGPHVVVLEEATEKLAFLPIDGLPDPNQVPIGTAGGGTGWNTGGSSVAVDDDGVAYYSPQSQSTTPVWACVPDTLCTQPFIINEPSNLRSQLNGLLYDDGYLYGVAPITGKVWRLRPSEPKDVDPFFELILGKNALQNGYGMAFGSGGSVAVGTLGLPALGDPPAYRGIVEISALPSLDYKVPAQEVDYPWVSLRAIAVGEDGYAYARAYEVGADHAVILRGIEGTFERLFEDLEITGSTAATMGGLVADDSFLYFFGERKLDTIFVRCPVGSHQFSDVCTSLMGERGSINNEQIFNTGPVAATDRYVFFADGRRLYRTVK